MAQTVQPALAAILINGVQRFASCWRVVRKDGVTFRFTDHDSPLRFEDGQAKGNVGGPVSVSHTGGYPAGTSALTLAGMTVGASYTKGEQIQFAGHQTPYTIKSSTPANGSGVGTITISPALFAAVSNTEVVSQIRPVYLPFNGITASARQRLSNLQSRNLDLVGVLDDDAITHADLRNGLYREAEVTEFLVDWRFPHEGAISRSRYWVSSVKFTGEQWWATVEGVSRFFQQVIGRTYTRVCRHLLGDSKCTVDLTPFTFSGEVTGIVVQRLTFKTDLTNATGYFRFGNLTWLTGDNVGFPIEVKDFTNTDGVVTIEIRTPKDIQIGDTFSIVKGCNKLFQTCIDDFDNPENFGGYPFIPGSDRLYLTPNQK